MQAGNQQWLQFAGIFWTQRTIASHRQSNIETGRPIRLISAMRQADNFYRLLRRPLVLSVPLRQRRLVRKVFPLALPSSSFVFERRG